MGETQVEDYSLASLSDRSLEGWLVADQGFSFAHQNATLSSEHTINTMAEQRAAPSRSPCVWFPAAVAQDAEVWFHLI